MLTRTSQADPGFLAPLLAAAWLAACGPGAGEDAVGLADALPLAEIRVEQQLIDFGTPEGRRHLESGWSWDETSADGTSFVWGLGDESSVELFLAAPRDLDVTVRCFPFTFPGAPPQEVSVVLNGQEVATLELARAAGEYALKLPAPALRAGTNRLVLRYAHSRSPAEVSSSRDRRRLAVGWEFLRFDDVARAVEPAARLEAGQVFLPFGSEAAYYLETPEPARLTASAVSVRGDPDGLLQVLWQIDGGEPRELVLEESRVLPDAAGQPFRLTLRAVGHRLDDETPRGVLLTRPTVRWRAAAEPVEVEAPTRKARLNVLLYLVDTLRADRLGCYGQQLPLTPHVDRLAAEGVVFERTIAQTSWTKPAVASVLTGLGPLRHGVNQATDALPEAAVTFAETLRGAGYRTAAFVTNPHVTEGSGFAQGFDRFDFSYDLAGDLNARVLSWIAAADGPFFAFVHTIDVHGPFEPLAPFRERFAADVDRRWGTSEHLRDLAEKKIPTTDEVVAGLERLYNAEVAQNDAAFGALWDGLRQRGLDQTTVIVLLSDHGEAFHEHGVVGHGWDLFQEVLDVPFVLRLPGGPRGRLGDLAQHVDVAPTLLDALGLPAAVRPPRSPQGDAVAGIQGRSLLPLVRGEVGAALPLVFSYMDYQKRRGASVIRGPWKLIEPLGGSFASGRQLYRPWEGGERDDLAAEYPVMSGYLATLARGELRRAGQGLPSAEVVLDAETRDALKALGYL